MFPFISSRRASSNPFCFASVLATMEFTYCPEHFASIDNELGLGRWKEEIISRNVLSPRYLSHAQAQMNTSDLSGAFNDMLGSAAYTSGRMYASFKLFCFNTSY